jgi:tetratricopeptide (TPR) repeat protein
VNHTTPTRFARLKALQRPLGLPLPERDVEPAGNCGEDGSASHASTAAGASDRLAHLLGASIKRNSHGEHLSLHCWYGGNGPCIPDAAALRLLAPDAPGQVADPEQWLFLDTETTGLAGGTGTYPFLVGLAWWEGGGLEVEQLFMREYSEERSLLAALAERLAERPVLVTFNGKSFDWPLLETRYRMTRTIAPPEPRAHLDFLHPARNLWRLRLGSVKRARKLYEQSIVSVLPEETNRAARAALARLAKRDGDLARAHELWESAVGNSREGYEAYEQLAIYYEHEARDPRRALTLAREALDQLRRANQMGTIAAIAHRRTMERFEHRILRLERKAGRTLLDTLCT